MKSIVITDDQIADDGTTLRDLVARVEAHKKATALCGRELFIARMEGREEQSSDELHGRKAFIARMEGRLK